MISKAPLALPGKTLSGFAKTTELTMSSKSYNGVFLDRFLVSWLSTNIKFFAKFFFLISLKLLQNILSIYFILFFLSFNISESLLLLCFLDFLSCLSHLLTVLDSIDFLLFFIFSFFFHFLLPLYFQKFL